ncbi:hypothetical protein ADK67_42320 [Saccharothrix sp. NRRL B-16348]|uniref:hypothetical protein n=1 Tax=Saccharothrix sp. NRRL B-16348 TaxID=1415542 RepID=UPI0006AF4A3E|nr:hypothetical protein [Saccharothrix sp. NRRL B-16348]KOX14442.1 hypothetical protein ADK67_42320 [Saccharothrix sp. NRRL B-16348]
MVGRRSWWWSPWWTVIASLVPMTLACWAVTPPGGYLTPLFYAGFAALAVAVAWLTMGGLAVVNLPRPRLRHAVRLWPFLLVPALFAATTVLTGLVPQAAFDAHRSRLEALVAEAEPGRRIEDRRLGLYTVSVSDDRPDGCTLITVADSGVLNTMGWAYCPDRVPVSAKGDGYKFTPFDGPWYEFTFEW